MWVAEICHHILIHIIYIYVYRPSKGKMNGHYWLINTHVLRKINHILTFFLAGAVLFNLGTGFFEEISIGL